MARDAATIRKEIEVLRSSMATGAQTIKIADRLTTYKSFEEMRRHLELLEAELAGADGSPRVRAVRFQTSTGA